MIEITAANNMFALWPGDQLNFSIFIKPTFGFVGQHAASEAGHIANTNVAGNALGTTRIMRRLIITISTIILGFIETFGCVCNDLDFKTILKTNDFVLVGRPMTNIHPDSITVRLLDNQGYGTEVYFKVEKVLKGELKQDIIVINQRGHGSCALGVKLGDRYLVFGHIRNYSPPPIGDFNPIVEIDSVTGKEEIVYVPTDNTSIVGDYVKTLKDKFDIVNTSSCGLFNERTKFYRQARKWIKKGRTISQV